MLPTDPSAPKKIRTFIALHIPPAWESSLSEVQRSLKKSLQGGEIKWVAPASIHITLRFLGYIEPVLVQSVSQRLSAIASNVPPFELAAEAPGCFPNCRNPRVIWAGLADPAGTLTHLQSSVLQGTRDFGQPPEDRPFKPHLTLARVKHLSRENARSLQAAIEEISWNPPSWKVNELVFFQSHLSQAGPAYQPLARFALSP